MEKITEQKARELVSFPKNFDFELIDQQYGFERKIFSLVDKEVFQELETSNPTAYNNLVTAGLHYSFVLSLPRIKVHLSNYGINQYEQGTTKNASWWDVRDLALSWLRKADFYLAKALNILAEKQELPFFKRSFSLLPFSETRYYFGEISPEVYLMLSDLMRGALDEFLSKMKPCEADVLLGDDVLKNLIKKYCIDKSIADATAEQGYLFTSTGIVVQYEELPWQKSVVLTDEEKIRFQERHLRGSERYLMQIWDYLNKNKDNFPCWNAEDSQLKVPIIAKKGGLFL